MQKYNIKLDKKFTSVNYVNKIENLVNTYYLARINAVYKIN